MTDQLNLKGKSSHYLGKNNPLKVNFKILLNFRDVQTLEWLQSLYNPTLINYDKYKSL